MNSLNENIGIQATPCEQCCNVVERQNVPHVIRKCEECGREMHVVETGEHGKGIVIRKGDRFSMPTSWLNLSMNPLTSKMFFSRAGLEMAAETIFLDGILNKEHSYNSDVIELEKQMDIIVNETPYIKPLDVNNSDHSEAIASALSTRKGTIEFWAFLAGHFLAQARLARAKNDAHEASWAVSCAERCRMMLVYKKELEAAVWMGQSAKRLVAALGEWDNHQTNNSEDFWQQTFNEHSYVLSQVFAVPVVFVQEKAYMGGARLDRSGGKYLDYLFAAESSSEVLLVEIKTPTARLLGSEYREGVYGPSAELAGAIVQVLTYKSHLTQDLKRLTEGTPHELKAFNPRSVVVLGNSKSELLDHSLRRSFELFRSSCDVEIITYDELFRKVEVLAQLFGLVRKPSGID